MFLKNLGNWGTRGKTVQADDKVYQCKIEQELAYYREVENVHDLPEIFHYWSNRYLLPMLQTAGFDNSGQFYLQRLSDACRKKAADTCSFVSVGAGNCDIEITLARKLVDAELCNFSFECVELNPHMVARGQSLAQEQGVTDYMRFSNQDIIHWQPETPYDCVIANQSLHHFVELEVLFGKIAQNLAPGGLFLSHDMIGRNGHMRWPETLEIINRVWREMPDKYKHNRQLKRFEAEYDNWDCSSEGLEGIRAQDILPLLLERFNFKIFLAWGGIVDIFIDRGFGHNFDHKDRCDRLFIDMLHFLNMSKLHDGSIKPTQVIAAMTTEPVAETMCYKNLTPVFCLRNPENAKSVYK